jgi:hypothetical protein
MAAVKNGNYSQLSMGVGNPGVVLAPDDKPECSGERLRDYALGPTHSRIHRETKRSAQISTALTYAVHLAFQGLE